MSAFFFVLALLVALAGLGHLWLIVLALERKVDNLVRWNLRDYDIVCSEAERIASGVERTARETRAIVDDTPGASGNGRAS